MLKISNWLKKDRAQDKDSASTGANRLPSPYRRASAKGLSLAVKPTVIGEVSQLDPSIPTFYVIRSYSRSNSLLVGMQTDALGLPSALAEVRAEGVHETSAMIFLRDRRSDAVNGKVPRLERLIAACLANPQLQVQLVPVTILWGRAPDKEDSLFRLLMANEWAAPSKTKQLFNIGVMGRDTFVRFSEPKDLQSLIRDAQAGVGDDLTTTIAMRLKGYLDKQRTSIVGPDLSDKRNIAGTILSSPVVVDAIEKHAAETGKSIAAVKAEIGRAHV